MNYQQYFDYIKNLQSQFYGGNRGGNAMAQGNMQDAPDRVNFGAAMRGMYGMDSPWQGGGSGGQGLGGFNPQADAMRGAIRQQQQYGYQPQPETGYSAPNAFNNQPRKRPQESIAHPQQTGMQQVAPPPMGAWSSQVTPRAPRSQGNQQGGQPQRAVSEPRPYRQQWG